MDANNAAVSLKNISKSYKIYSAPADRLKEALWWRIFNKRKVYYKDFWALKDVNLEIPRGVTFGIVGKNGSGKSTLLQIIASILQPTTGSVRVHGNISTLLELGAGFNREFTGRENVFMNGSILGISNKEMKDRFANIESFADIGEFMDQPVKTYSSGMFLRLAFAIAINVDPDILLIDEALAVGDFKFRQKCSEKINELQKKTTIVLVSHSMRDILMLCSKAIVFDNGKIVCYGTAKETVDFYTKQGNATDIKKSGDKINEGDIKTGYKSKIKSALFGEMCHTKGKITDVKAKWVDEAGKRMESFEHGTAIALEFSFNLLYPATNLAIGISFWNQNGHNITGISTDLEGKKIEESMGLIKGKLEMDRLIFNAGSYDVSFAVVDNKEFLYRNLVSPLKVKDMPVSFGLVTPNYSWRFEK